MKGRKVTTDDVQMFRLMTRIQYFLTDGIPYTDTVHDLVQEIDGWFQGDTVQQVMYDEFPCPHGGDTIEFDGELSDEDRKDWNKISLFIFQGDIWFPKGWTTEMMTEKMNKFLAMKV